jgi:hypothetical protein
VHKNMQVVGLILATTGLAFAVKHIMRKKEQRSGRHKIKVKDEKRTGSRIGSEIRNKSNIFLYGTRFELFKDIISMRISFHLF